jgi:(p)ppGpp synthase/HD superfamily hydrolase
MKLKEHHSELEMRADAFAARAHGSIDQRRKYTNEPYIVHPRAVAAIVKTVEHTPEMVACALLHDVVEDTPVTLDQIREEFGDEVAMLVDYVTERSKKSDGNRATRKAIDRAHFASGPAAAQTVKFADMIHNASDILSHDPGFARVYIREMNLSIPMMKRGDPVLRERLERILAHKKRTLEGDSEPQSDQSAQHSNRGPR